MANRIDKDLISQLDRVERESFVTLYRAARAHGTGSIEIDGVTAVWSGGDDDPSFSCVLDLARSPQPEQTLQRLEDAVRDRGGLVLGVDTHPDLEGWATEERFNRLGFHPDCQECIWARPLDTSFESRPLPPGVQIERAGIEDNDVFISVLNLGWGLDEDAARGHVFAAGIGLPDWYHYVAYVDGEPAGISVLLVHERVADCFLATTLPAFRGRGVQTALIERRLADGLAAGCDLATSQTVVDNASPRNMARRGFQPLYRRWIYGKRLRH